MLMQPRPWPEVPAETSRVVGKAFPKGTLPIRVRDQLGSWYDDEVFTAAYGVRGRLDWKYCLGLALEDEDFDFSVLSEFRARLVAGGVELAILDLLLDRLKGLGLVKAGGRQRTDSTHVLGRIRELNRLELVGESVRAALEARSAAAPGLAGRRDRRLLAAGVRAAHR
ncbi:MAG: transposase [Pseudonocardiaceae bacterium]